MKKHYMPIQIDIRQAEALIPRTIESFGEREFKSQLNIYNEFMTRFPPDSPAARYHRWTTERYKKINNSIFNCLYSLLENQNNIYYCRIAAPLIHLEVLLESAAKGNYSPTTFSSMVRSSESFWNVIAELDIGEILRQSKNSLKRHVPRDNSNNRGKNFDLRWTPRNLSLLADVKWFQDWLVRPNGQDLLSVTEYLIGKDLKHLLYISFNDTTISDEKAIKACEEIGELYRAIMSSAKSRSNKWVSVEKRAGKAWYVESKPLKPQHIVKSITVDKRISGESKIIIIQNNLDDGKKDRAAIQRNLIGASSQIPSNCSGSETTCVFLGSHEGLTESDEVEEVLLGKYELHPITSKPVRDGGLFSMNSPITDLIGLDSVVYFSYGYEVDSSTNEILIRRFAKPFINPRLSVKRKKNIIISASEAYKNKSGQRLSLP